LQTFDSRVTMAAVVAAYDREIPKRVGWLRQRLREIDESSRPDGGHAFEKFKQRCVS